MNILIFDKSNSKLHFFGPLSRYVRTLIINISSSKVPKNKVHIHSVRNVCKLVIIFHLSWQDLSRNVDHPFKNPTQRVRVQTNGAELKYSIHLAHAQTKCPYAGFITTCVYWRGNLRVCLVTQRKSIYLRLLASPFAQSLIDKKTLIKPCYFMLFYM